MKTQAPSILTHLDSDGEMLIPGLWKVKRLGCGDWYVEARGLVTVARVNDEPEAEANAHLIGAAPWLACLVLCVANRWALRPVEDGWTLTTPEGRWIGWRGGRDAMGFPVCVPEAYEQIQYMMAREEEARGDL